MQETLIDPSGIHKAQKASGLDGGERSGGGECPQEESGFHAVFDHIMESLKCFEDIMGADYIFEKKKRKKEGIQRLWQGEEKTIQEICGQNVKRNLKMAF